MAYSVTSGYRVIAYAQYTYDNDGRVIAMLTPAMRTFYTYNLASQLTSLQNLTPDGYVWSGGGGGITDSFDVPHTIINTFSNITYDALGDRTGMQFMQRRYFQGYETAEDPTTCPEVLLPGSATWGYDNGGRLISENWTGNFNDTTGYGDGYSPPFNPPTSLTYGYDGADNLTTCRGYSQSVESSSDAVLSTTSNPFLNTSIAYDSSTEMTTVGATFFNIPSSGTSRPNGTLTASYDAMGQVTGLGENSMEYDYLGRRTQNASDYFTYDGDELILDSQQYLWGPTGLALSFQVSGNSSWVTSYAFDPQGNCVDSNVATSSSGAAFTENYYYNTFPYGQGDDGNGYIGCSFYDAYGALLFINKAGGGAETTPIAYKGQFGYYADDSYGGGAGLGAIYYCIHRYYDANIGRWISRDPSGLDGGVNTYAYCGGNPVLGVDPSGLDWGLDVIAGWGDTLSFGGTKVLRKIIGNALGIGDANQVINFNSNSYHVGVGLGTVHQIGMGAAGGLRALFARGAARGWLNAGAAIGAHVVEKHVAKTLSYTILRSLFVTGRASTFSSVATAESAVEGTILSNNATVLKWLAKCARTGNTNSTLTITRTFAKSLGYGAARGLPRYGLRTANVILKYTGMDASGNPLFDILTAYPGR